MKKIIFIITLCAGTLLSGMKRHCNSAEESQQKRDIIKHNLYKKTCTFWQTMKLSNQAQALFNVIHDFTNAQNSHNITAHEMGKYAYNQPSENAFFTKECVSILFLFLQRYKDTSQVLNKSTPTVDQLNAEATRCFAHNFFLESLIKNQPPIRFANIMHLAFEEYDELAKNIKQLDSMNTENNQQLHYMLHNMIYCLYDDKANITIQDPSIPQINCPTALQDTIFNKLHYLCSKTWDSNTPAIIPILKLIEQAREKYAITEDNLGYYAFNYQALHQESNPQSNSDSDVGVHQDQYVYTKIIISLLLKLIEKYNTKRLYKFTPSTGQVLYYTAATSFNVINQLPNKEIVNTNEIALQEFQQLCDNIHTLKVFINRHGGIENWVKNHSDTVNTIVKSFYPGFKETEFSQ